MSSELIRSGKTALGIELGSTRIKAVLIDLSGEVLAVGFHNWENQLINGIWTYSIDDIHRGLRGAYSSLRAEVEEKYGEKLTKIGALGISAMMHGYMALDKDDNQIAPFQTWRNTNTQEAADELTALFDFNIPLRWTVAHLYQRILDGEKHLEKLAFASTLAGYIHYKLTGKKVIGIGDAAGMFPIDSDALDYDKRMIGQFRELIKDRKYNWDILDVFPKVLVAGENAGTLTKEGRDLLDETGTLEIGIPFAPPEGDAGTGMVATNAVAPRTGNVSCGTSIFAMLVVEKQLSKLHREIDMVTTPAGLPCAMSHANNGTSDLNAWVSIFGEFAKMLGQDVKTSKLFDLLYFRSLEGDADCGGLMSYGYYSGENVLMLNDGRLAFLRTANSKFSIANFMRSHLYSAFGAVRLGLDILFKEEGVKVDRIMGHGGIFKTPEVAQRYLSASVNAPVTVMDTSGEGGAWGIAVLAAYLISKEEGEKLEDYLEHRIFSKLSGTTIMATPEEVKGYDVFMERYVKAFPVEEKAVETMDWRD